MRTVAMRPTTGVPRPRRGLTLLELLVVLLILAILTMIAVQSTDNLVEPARYDATVRTMQNIQDAMIGPGNQRNPDGTILVTGFVADTGRVPAVIDELVNKPDNLATFSLFNAQAVDPT